MKIPLTPYELAEIRKALAAAAASGLGAFALAFSDLNITHAEIGHIIGAAILGGLAVFGIKNAPTAAVRAALNGPRALGRRKWHDAKSKDYPARTAAVLRSLTWKHYGPVLDQGQLGSCVGNAMAQALNTKPLREGRPLLREADARALYSTATKLDRIAGEWPPTDTGTSGLAGAKAAKLHGYISGYSHAFGLDHILGALMLGPLIVGTKWYGDMFNPDARGYVHPTGQDLNEGHEYLLLGVNLRRKRLIFLNSWGAGWGRKGRFYMTFDDFSKLLAEGGDAVAPRPA